MNGRNVQMQEQYKLLRIYLRFIKRQFNNDTFYMTTTYFGLWSQDLFVRRVPYRITF